jgi:beta-lactamase regulating signal transducer with metallopeptidase domain/protocatechuate 3,4-dioxygenase beta subunit
MDPHLIELLAGSLRELLAVDIVVKATLVLIAAGAIAAALHRSSAAARHLAWCVGLSVVLAMPALSVALPGWSWRVLPAATEAGRPNAVPSGSSTFKPAPSGAATQSLAESSLEDDALHDGGFARRLPSGSSHASQNPPPVRSRSVFTASWWWLWVAWLAGAMTVLSAPIAGRIALHRWAHEAEPIVSDDWTGLLRDLSARLGLSRRIALLRSARAATPMTWGLVQPVVLLPAEADSWCADRRRDVLLHELAHVKRLDCLTHAIASVACAVYWFHPLAWFAKRRMRVERERACDDIVLQAGARASDYAGHLLEMARVLRVPRAARLATLALARPSQLEGRLLAILDPTRRREGPGWRMALIALVTATLVLLPLATLQLGTRASATSVRALERITEDPHPANPSARMTLTGRVLDPSGKPVPDAAVMIIVVSKYASQPLLERTAQGAMTAHEGRCDGSGRFRIELPRTTSARQHGLTVTAMAPGYGMGWTELDPDADPPVADVALRTELIVHGQTLDAKGQPAPRVALRIEAMLSVARGTISTAIFRPDYEWLRRRDFHGWPGPAVSDDQGRFALRGLSRDLLWRIFIDDPRFAAQRTTLQMAQDLDARQLVPVPRIRVDLDPNPKPIAITLQPARTIVGRVTYADTGRPVPRALVAPAGTFFEADAEGRFRLLTGVAPNNRFGVRAQSSDGAPYLMTAKTGEWPQGAVEQSLDIALPRGAVVRGKITEEGTGRPVAGAVVRVTPTRIRGAIPPSFDVPGLTGADGSYRVAAPPGPGHLVVQGPDDDYVLHEIGGERAMYVSGAGKQRLYAHAYRAVDLRPGGPDHEVDLTLRRGAALRGQAVGPDGQPARDAWICSRLMLRTQADGGWKAFIIPEYHSRSQLRDGRFVLHGLDPNAAVEVPAYFLDPVRKLGTVARFSGLSGADGPVTVRLEPCGTARARLVTSDGKPVERYDARTLASLVVTPGPVDQRRPAKVGPLFAEEANVIALDPVNYGNNLQSDAQGRITLPALIPGATYRIEDITPAFGDGDVALRKEFIVKPGETVDLGEILIARPRRMNTP